MWGKAEGAKKIKGTNSNPYLQTLNKKKMVRTFLIGGAVLLNMGYITYYRG